MDAKLIIVVGLATKREIVLDSLPLRVGRTRAAGLPIAHPLVSRNHCEIFELNGALVVRDLGSANGTKINQQAIQEEVLRPGDRLTIGPLTFQAVYEYPGEVPDLETLQRQEPAVAPFGFVPEGEPIETGEVAIDDDDQLTAALDSQIESFPAFDNIQETPPAKPIAAAKVNAPKPAPAKPAPPVKAKAPDKLLPPKKPAPPAKADEGSLIDLSVDDLLMDESSISPDAEEDDPKRVYLEESGVLSMFQDSGVRVDMSESIVGVEVEDSGLRPVSIQDDTQPSLKAQKKKVDDQVTVALEESHEHNAIEDSVIGATQKDSGVGPPIFAQAAAEAPMEVVPMDDDTDDFLLTRDGRDLAAPVNRRIENVLHGEHSEDSEAGRKIASQVLGTKAWQHSGIGVDQLHDHRQPTNFKLRLQLADAGHLRVSSPVRVAGIDVGMISDLTWVAIDGQLRAEALLNIQKRLGGVLSVDLRIRVRDVTDGAVIVIESPGTSPQKLTHGQVVYPVTDPPA